MVSDCKQCANYTPHIDKVRCRKEICNPTYNTTSLLEWAAFLADEMQWLLYYVQQNSDGTTVIKEFIALKSLIIIHSISACVTYTMQMFPWVVALWNLDQKDQYALFMLRYAYCETKRKKNSNNNLLDLTLKFNLLSFCAEICMSNTIGKAQEDSYLFDLQSKHNIVLDNWASQQHFHHTYSCV